MATKSSLVGIPLTAEQMAVIGKNIRNARKKEEQRQERQTEDVDIIVGTHDGCGGDIHYTSSFEYTGDVRNLKLGGDNPLTEIKKCSCDTCGLLFDADFKLYRDKVIAYRNRTTK